MPETDDLHTNSPRVTPAALEIVIGANFVASGLREFFDASMAACGWPVRATVISPEQFVPELLRPRKASLAESAIIVLIDIERWIHPLGNISHNPNLISMREFCDALEIASNASSAQYLLVISCPSSPSRMSSDVTAAERALALKLSHDLPWIDFVGSAELNRYYPFTDSALCFSEYTDVLADMPYSPHGYAQLALMASRALARRLRKPKKMIVADCDNTLWSGNCGEVGVAGVQVTADHEAIQNFLIDQVNGGRLLCLCSKNDSEAVWAVFDSIPNMRLQRHHIARAMVNWDDKPVNIDALASELNVPLDAIVFVDDDERECAFVEARLPEVTTVCVKGDPSRFMAIILAVCEFDVEFPHTTRQLPNRTKPDAAPCDESSRQLSASKFLKELNLEVRIEQVEPNDILRVSELTYRTTQFNTSCVQLGPLAVRRLTGTCRCKAVFAADRLGDYGLIGFMSYERVDEKCIVGQFLLSCRAIGKQIEDRMLKHLIEEAALGDAASLEFVFRRTARNHLAEEFLDRFELRVIAQQPDPKATGAEG